MPRQASWPTIRAASSRAAGDPNFPATDDCTVVLRYLPEVPIVVVPGHERNMKVTEPIDVHIADKLFQLQSASLSLESMTSVPDLTGQSVVVFGGSYGIGESIVEQARQAGAIVSEFSRTSTGTDIKSAKAVRRALAEVKDAVGRIDVVIVTAGVLRIAPLVESRKRDLKDTIEVTLIAPAIVAREAHAHLAETSGQVVLFTSSSYTRGRAGYSAYSATKAGVVNLTQALAEAPARRGRHKNIAL